MATEDYNKLKLEFDEHKGIKIYYRFFNFIVASEEYERELEQMNKELKSNNDRLSGELLKVFIIFD